MSQLLYLLYEIQKIDLIYLELKQKHDEFLSANMEVL